MLAMTAPSHTDFVRRFGRIVSIEESRELIANAVAMTEIPKYGPYTNDERIQLCTIIENQESGKVAEVAHELRVRSEMEKHFRGLFAVLPDPAMIVMQEDETVSVLVLNETGQEMLDTEMCGECSLAEIVKPVGTDDFEQDVHHHLSNDEPLRKHLTIRTQGRPRHFMARFSPILGDEIVDNGVLNADMTTISHRGVLVFTDITEQKHRQEEIEHLQQVTDVMNRVLRHNLRNAMTTVLGQADILKTRFDDEVALDSAETIARTGKKLIETSQNARTVWNCVEQIKRQEIELTSLVRSHLATYGEDYADAQIRTDFPPEAPAIGDDHLHSVLENALKNGIEHNDKETPVIDLLIRNEETSGEIILEVSDNGPGIPDHQLAVLDEGIESPLQHGNGLGIWLIYWIAQQYGGTVDFADREPTGTRVVIRLPRSSNQVTRADPSIE